MLTPTSITKPWVNAEIDAAFVRRVAGVSKLIALRCGVDVSSLSPFLAAQMSQQFRPGSDEDFERLVADIYGVGLKPALSPKPRYLKGIPEGLAAWSTGAVAAAGFLVTHSKSALFADPQVTVDEVAAATGLPEAGVADAVFELADAGLVEVRRSREGSNRWFCPKPSLFVEFDRHLAGIDSKGDAAAIVTWLLNTGSEGATADDVAAQFSEWNDRRINSALTYLDETRVVLSSKSNDPRWAIRAFMLNKRSRRFARENA